MLFFELRFILFFLLVFLVYWQTPWTNVRKIWLLASSYFFYGCWDWRFLGLLLMTTLLDFAFARAINKTTTIRNRKIILWISISLNIGVLGLFKYYNFFLENLLVLLDILGIQKQGYFLQIFLPIGISFYTFQSMSYVIDVYRKTIPPTKNILDFALYIAFFPQLVAGPIVRAGDFLPQLKDKKLWSNIDFRWLCTLFLFGFIKKTVIADNLAPIVDLFYSCPEKYSNFSAWLAAMFFVIQLFCDFSGYSDMGIACAGLLGFYLKPNFYFPFFSTSYRVHWRRWHISLSNWVFDYIFYPLYKTPFTKYVFLRNIMLTFVLVGLWHGASWNFVCWGALLGGFYFIEMVGKPLWQILHKHLGKMGPFISMAAVFFISTTVNVLFRAKTFPQAEIVFSKMFFFSSKAVSSLNLNWFLLIPFLLVIHWANYREIYGKWWERLSGTIYLICYIGLFLLLILITKNDYKPFIYFEF